MPSEPFLWPKVTSRKVQPRNTPRNGIQAHLSGKLVIAAGDLNWASHQGSCLLSSFPWTELLPRSWPVPSDSPLYGQPSYPCGFQHFLCSGSSCVCFSSTPISTSSIHCTVLGCPWPTPDLPRLGSLGHGPTSAHASLISQGLPITFVC